MLDEGIGSDSKVSMLVALMDSLYAALGLFVNDAEKLPLMVHKKVRLGAGLRVRDEWKKTGRKISEVWQENDVKRKVKSEKGEQS